MGLLKIKAIRFFLNIILYATILISATYYMYTFQPGFYTLKNIFIPIEGVIFLTLILSVLFAGINEIITMLVLRFSRRQQKT